MGNIHINSNGEPGACKAKNGGCPFGSEDTHFESPEQAETAYSEAQKAMGNSVSAGNNNAFKGAFSYTDNKIDAERVANIIANEGKIAVIAKVSRIHLNEVGLPGGVIDADDYEEFNVKDEDGEDDYDEDAEAEYDQAVEDIAQAAIEEDFSKDDFDEPDMGQVSHDYLVRAFDNEDQVKEYNKNEDWSPLNYKTVDVDMDNPNNESESEFASNTDLNTSDLTVTKINISIVRPKKESSVKNSKSKTPLKAATHKFTPDEELAIKQGNAQAALAKGFPSFKISKTDRTKIEKILETGKVTDKAADELLQHRETMSLRSVYDSKEVNDESVESSEKVFGYIQALRDKSDAPSTLKTADGFDPATETMLSNKDARTNPYVAAKALKKNLDEANRLKSMASERAERFESSGDEYEKSVIGDETKALEIESNRLLARSEAISKEMLWLAENDAQFKAKVDSNQLRSLQNISKNATYKDIPIIGVKKVK